MSNFVCNIHFRSECKALKTLRQGQRNTMQLCKTGKNSDTKESKLTTKKVC